MNTEGLSNIQIADAQPEAEVPVVDVVDVPVAELEPAPAPVAVIPGLDDSSLYIHRELSQLQFNIRVLEQARDES